MNVNRHFLPFTGLQCYTQDASSTITIARHERQEWIEGQGDSYCPLSRLSFLRWHSVSMLCIAPITSQQDCSWKCIWTLYINVGLNIPFWICIYDKSFVMPTEVQNTVSEILWINFSCVRWKLHKLQNYIKSLPQKFCLRFSTLGKVESPVCIKNKALKNILRK